MDLKTVDHLLTTTRAVRKRLDLERPVEAEIIQECLDIAIQAPTGSNGQHWAFVVITDAEKRAEIARYYGMAWADYIKRQTFEGTAVASKEEMQKVGSSAQYLADNYHRVPVMIIPCYRGRVEDVSQVAQASLYGSIAPAAWSLMLALRSRGIGTAWTTLHLNYEREVSDLLNIPADYTQLALIPAAYYTGDDFQPANRRPASEITYWDNWGDTL